METISGSQHDRSRTFGTNLLVQKASPGSHDFFWVAVLPAMVFAHKFLTQIELVSCTLVFHMMHRILGSLGVSPVQTISLLSLATHSNFVLFSFDY